MLTKTVGVGYGTGVCVTAEMKLSHKPGTYVLVIPYRVDASESQTLLKEM